MLKPVDEFELERMPATGGVYAFHLRAIRLGTIGLESREPIEVNKIESIREKVYIQLSKMLQLEESLKYTGNISEPARFKGHGVEIRLEGAPCLPIEYLRNEIARVPRHNIRDFIIHIEKLSTFMPPLYVGITLSQSLRDRYIQHKNNHIAGVGFGGRLANAGFEWRDVIFSIDTETIRMENEAVKVLENYIHFMSRPRLGLS